MSSWPASHDYTIAVQSPQICFRDGDLKTAQIERVAVTGMPKVWTGNFAQVYQLTGVTGRWAVKCFTRPVPDIRARYAAIAEAIGRSGLDCFVEFELIADEMLVCGIRYPIVKMRWVEGQPLDGFVQANLYRPRTLLETAASLLDLVRALERKRVAHGDLQHGNIVVTPSGIRLVDYDGVFVPAFAGGTAPEAGMPCYQHPRRAPSDYGVGLDRFSVLTICTALSALAADPGLWREFYTGNNLLFTSADFADPAASPLLQRLRALDDPQVRGLAQALVAACDNRPLDVPLPRSPLSLNAAPRHAFWWLKGYAKSGGEHAAGQNGGNGNGSGGGNGHAEAGSNGNGHGHEPAATGTPVPAWTRLLNRKYRIRVKLPAWPRGGAG